jgi:hypothetical protein
MVNAPHTLPNLRDPHLAEAFYAQLEWEITEAYRDLNAGQQLLVFYDTPRGERITVEHLGFQNVNLIYVFGRDEQGRETTVIAHMNTVQLIFKIAVGGSAPARRIGFLGAQGTTKATPPAQ